MPKKDLSWIGEAYKEDVAILDKVAEAITNGSIYIDGIIIDNFSKEIRKMGRNITEESKKWKKISFCYKLG